ncbi:class I SAM-dependent methyltransferase [Leucothrix arctica]|uniref:class I SAM-dependent methyltransferase n=1 Tax=Leucothrix arctica TaxID=1481894 RepID=UPI001304A5A6|nr:class I SAM-dependent methyltransferase [Leucothrix arctica]
MYELITKHFSKGNVVLDVGCGTGRDCDWLSLNGYLTTGVDASTGMLNLAKDSYPNISFIQDSLPKLTTIKTEQFANVLCSAVIMHLPEDQLEETATNLLRVTEIGGCVLITYRGSPSDDNRESGKLYTPLAPNTLIQTFERLGATLVSHAQNTEEERGHVWNNLVFRK